MDTCGYRSSSESSSDEGPQRPGKTEVPARKYKRNIQPSAVNVLGQIPGLTASLIFSILHTARLVLPIEPVYDLICSYVANSQDHEYGIRVVDIIRIARKADPDHFPLENNDPDEKPEIMALCHGTKTENVPGILTHGFKIPKTHDERLKFAPGIYFADRVSKATNYCRNVNPGQIGYFFLCDVKLGGTSYNASRDRDDAQYDNIGRRFDSLICDGEMIPHPDGNLELNGSIFPTGVTVKNDSRFDYKVLYNEFVVYNGENVIPRYLVKVEFME